MQIQTPVKKRIPYASVFVAIGCILIIIRIILYYLPAKSSAVPADVHNTPPVSESVENSIPEVTSVSEKKEAVSSPIDSGTFRLIAGGTDSSLPITGESLLSILTVAKERGEITFSGQEYSGLGFFVTQLGSLKEGNGKHLMYYINGKEASVGVSIYVPKIGDFVVWELK
jgi:hypothetical protein